MIDYKSLEVGDLTAASINSNIHKGTIVKGIIYDTSKDSDGGAWRKRCQDKSWYTETLGGTNWLGQVSTAALAWAALGAVPGSYFQNSTDGLFYQLGASSPTVTQVYRGNVREFPAVAAIVAEAGRVVIYDLTQSGAPMWMVFSYTGMAGPLSSVVSINGQLSVTNSHTDSFGVLTWNFASDSGRMWYTSGSKPSAAGVSTRISWGTAFPGSYSGAAIVNGSVNDVAITVLDTAPIDPATGLPVPTVVCQTGGGISVIKDDGVVTNHAFAVSGDTISLVGDTLRYSMAAAMAGYRRISLINLPTPTFSGTQFAPTVGVIGRVKLGVTSSEHVGTGTGTVGGVVVAKEDPSTVGRQMLAYITNAYNSGWLPGDIRGAYLADTVAETIAASGELAGAATTFNNSTGLTLGTGWSVAGGVATSDGTLSAITIPNTLVIGETYTATVTVTARTSGSLNLPYDGGGGSIVSVSTTGTFTRSFVATTTTLNVGYSNAFIGSIDNASVKLAEPDRSVKNKGLVINGTLTKAAVASGAGLVAYSGFSASNYLEQPYNSDLDFGTGDFCVMGWVNLTGVGSTRFLSRTDKTGATFGTNSSFSLMLSSGNWYFQSVTGNWTTGVAATTGLHFVVLTFSATSLKLYVDNTLVASTTLALNITSTGSPVLLLGSGWYNGAIVDAVQGSLALWRVSATAPSADQIAHIYRTELPLFQANAQCTLAGTSTAVTALAYDDVADALHVGTSWGRSEFKGLLRVASEATTTGSITSLSANEGVILTGGTSAKVYAPAMYLRDELRRKDVARKALGRVPAFFDYTATASQTAFVAPKGYTIKALYKNGTLMRETTTGTYWTRSHDGFQETATLSVGASVSDWVSIMCVRS